MSSSPIEKSLGRAWGDLLEGDVGEREQPWNGRSVRTATG